MRSSSKTQHLRLNRVLLLDSGEKLDFSVFVTTDGFEIPFQVTQSTRITLHFVSPYEYTFGFIANLGKSQTAMVPNEQLLVNWKPYFERTHGFFASTGDFIALESGYYLITFQITLLNVKGRVTILLYKGESGKGIVANNEYFRKQSDRETLTYSYVYKLSEKQRLRFKIKTPDAKVGIDPSSSYSAVLVESCLTPPVDPTSLSITGEGKSKAKEEEVNYQFAALQQDNLVAPDQELQLFSWKNFHNHTAYLVNSAFQIRRSSFYFVQVKVHFTGNSGGAPIRVELRVESRNRYLLFQQNLNSRAAYFFGVLYIKVEQSISVNVINESPNTITINRDSTTMFIYELKLQTYSTLYEILSKPPISPNNLLKKSISGQSQQHELFLVQKQTSNFNIITSTKDDIIIEILKEGIYYAALDILFADENKNHQGKDSGEFIIMIRETHQESWTSIAKCIGDRTKQCFIPLILTLEKGQAILIKGSKIAGNLVLGESHFHLNYICPNSTHDRSSPKSTGNVQDAAKTLSVDVRKTDTLVFKLPSKGYYLITGSLILGNLTGLTVKINIKYTIGNRRERTITSLKKKLYNSSSQINFALSEGFAASEANITINLYIEVTGQDWQTSSSHYSIVQGLFSYLLITEDTYRFKSLKAIPSTISAKGTVNFRARQTYQEQNKYISDQLFLQSIQSISSLVTVNLIGKILPKNGGLCDSGKISTGNRKIYAWIRDEAHFQTSASQLQCGDTVLLHLTGLVITHPMDFIKVDVEIDPGLAFKVAKYSSVSVFVLKDTMPFVFTSSDYLDTDFTAMKLPNDDDGGGKEGSDTVDDSK